MKKITHILMIMFAVAATFAFADDVADDIIGDNVIATATTRATPTNITVGDIITFAAEFEVNAQHAVIPPETDGGFGNFVVLSQDENIVAADDGENVVATYTYNITTFRPQNCTIPSVKFLIGDGEHIDTVQTVPVPITVLSVLPQDAPSCQLNIQDLKAQQKTGGPDLRFLWIILIIALIVAAILLVKKYAKKKLTSEETVVIKPPYEEALDSIEKLLDKRYVEKGLVREYAFELSEIFKRYIGRRYETNAVELTTEEMCAYLKTVDITTDVRICAERFFRTSDMVKFAKWQPDRQTVDRFLLDVKTFLDETKPAPVETQTSTDAQTSSENKTDNAVTQTSSENKTDNTVTQTSSENQTETKNDNTAGAT